MSEILNIFLKKRRNLREMKNEKKLILKPAEKNINFSIVDNITYNLILNMTQFKNKEINNNDLNINLLCNLSLFLSKGNEDLRKKKFSKKKITKANILINKCSIENFGIYFPINRISCLDHYQNKNNAIKNNINDNNNDINNIKIPHIYEKFDAFYSSYLNIFNYDNKNIITKVNNINLNKNESNNISLNDSLSCISEDSSKEMIKIHSKSNNDKKNFEKNYIFVKYKELNDYIECPLISNDNIKKKYNDFILLLDNLDNIFEYNEIYHNNKNITDKIMIDNNDIIKINKTNKSNRNSITNKEKKNENIINNIREEDKLKDISNSIKKRYKKKMNEKYILIIYEIYSSFKSNCNWQDTNDLIAKKYFVKFFQKFLLECGISNKKMYEKIIRYQILSNKILSFEQFIQSFDVIISDNNMNHMKQKYLFLLNIIIINEKEEFINLDKIKLFFELVGCYDVYIPNFSENLGDKLLVRYKGIYQNEEKNNFLDNKFRLKKMKIILESFFDQIQFDE